MGLSAFMDLDLLLISPADYSVFIRSSPSVSSIPHLHQILPTSSSILYTPSPTVVPNLLLSPFSRSFISCFFLDHVFLLPGFSFWIFCGMCNFYICHSDRASPPFFILFHTLNSLGDLNSTLSLFFFQGLKL